MNIYRKPTYNDQNPIKTFFKNNVKLKIGFYGFIGVVVVSLERNETIQKSSPSDMPQGTWKQFPSPLRSYNIRWGD